MTLKLRAWGHSKEPQAGDKLDSNDNYGTETLDHGDSGDYSKHPDPASPTHSHTAMHRSAITSTGAYLLTTASSLLRKVPLARRVSLLNASLLALLGLGAALAAGAGGCTALLVLLARWYLPAQQAHVSLPLHFDYSAGPSAAGAWLPLLRHTPVTSALTPPPHQQSPSAAAPLTFRGNLGPGGSFSVASTTDGGSGGGSGFGRQLGFLGLGFGPAGRAAAASDGSRQRSSRGWLGGLASRRKERRQRSSSADVARAGGVDVGSGVVVPEVEWLVPVWGRVGVAVELEMPRYPEPDLVQITGEIISQQGIVLARNTRTWVPKPRPLLFRIAGFFIFGPWRALGLMDDSVRVQLPLFEGFQNPQPPPGGWGSVMGLNPAKADAATRECAAPGEAAEPASAGSSTRGAGDGWAAAAAAAAAGEAGDVAGPRAMWLRLTMIGRSAGLGPPRVYSAAAQLHTHLRFLDWLAVAVRPGLAASLMLLTAGLGLAVGGTATSAVLLALAYALYRWGTADDSSDDKQYSNDGRSSAAAEPGGAVEDGRQQQGGPGDEAGEGFYEPGYERRFSAVGFEGSSVSGVGVEAGYVEAEESSVHDAEKALLELSPASFEDSTAEASHEQYAQPSKYSGSYGMLTSPDQLHGRLMTAPLQHKEQQQQQQQTVGSSMASAVGRMLGWKQGAAGDESASEEPADGNQQRQQRYALEPAAEDGGKEHSVAASAAAAAADAVATASATAELVARAEEEISSQTANAFRRAGFAYQP